MSCRSQTFAPFRPWPTAILGATLRSRFGSAYTGVSSTVINILKGWAIAFGSVFGQAFHRVWQQYIGRFITVIKSGILTLIGIMDGLVSSFFRVPLFKRVGGLRVVRLLGLSSSLGFSRWCC